MAEERATRRHEFWSYRFGVVPTPGQRYLSWRHRLCAPHVAGKRVLDVPSGEGLGHRYFRSALSLTSIDYSHAALMGLPSRSSPSGKAVCASMTSLPFTAASYDCVVSLEGLEHLDKADGVDFLGEVHRVLAPGGTFLLSCPISSNGRHSGNRYHLHEWSWGDLKEVLTMGFDIAEVRTNAAIGDAVWCLLKPRREAGGLDWRESVRVRAARQVEEAFAHQRRWLDDAFGDHPESGLWRGGVRSLLPTCFAVLAAESCGLSMEARSAAVVRHIKERQSPIDGSFDLGTIKRRHLTSHSATYLRLQASYFSIHALNALGARPDHRFKLIERLQDLQYLRGWLDGGPWHNPWLHSNTIMFALTFLQTDAAWHADEASAHAFDAILDYLDERQDPQSGLWQPDDEPDIANAVYAAYHFFPYYFWRGRQPRFADRIIDSVLSIQQPGGLFGGGACEDLDAVHTLVMMSAISQHRRQDVRVALERCFWRLLQTQNVDGGFPNYVAAPTLPKSLKRRLAERSGLMRLLPVSYQGQTAARLWHYGGWRELACPFTESDSWSAWFRPLALRLIADSYPDLAGGAPAGKYRSLPGLGWHDMSLICSATKTP
jgi:SAM-dependent methyltransferase